MPCAIDDNTDRVPMYAYIQTCKQRLIGEDDLVNWTRESVTRGSFENRDAVPKMSFWSIIGLGSFLATYMVAVELLLYWTDGGHTRPFVPMNLKESDVLAALAAVATGTIALQVMAQSSTSSRAATMADYNHRMLIAYLAVGGTAASCTLALSSLVAILLDGIEQHLAYLLVVALLAAMNSLIAADAARRIVRVEFKNPTIRVIEAKRVSEHYNKLKPYPTMVTSRLRRVSKCLGQALVLGTVAGILDIVLTSARWSDASAYVLGSLVITGVLLPAVRHAGLQWYKPSLFSRLAAPIWLLMILVPSGFVIAAMDRQDAILHQVALLGVPTLLPLLGLLRLGGGGVWILPGWVPGAFIRESVYRKIFKDAGKAALELEDAEATLAADRLQERVVAGGSRPRTKTRLQLILEILATKRE